MVGKQVDKWTVRRTDGRQQVGRQVAGQAGKR